MSIIVLNESETRTLVNFELEVDRRTPLCNKTLDADCYRRCGFIRRLENLGHEGRVDVLLYDFEVWADGDRRDGLAALLASEARIDPSKSEIALSFSQESYQMLYLVLEYSAHHCWTSFVTERDRDLCYRLDHDDQFMMFGDDEAQKRYEVSGLRSLF